MREIILDCGSIVMVSDEDYDFITLCYDLKINKDGYVHCKLKKKFRKEMGLYTNITLHKLLMNPEKTGRSINVDHIDRNKLNNTKENLRICSHAENMRNRKKSGITSIYKGVYWHSKNKCWMAQIGVDDKNIALGKFYNEVAAGNCYNYFAIFYHGEFAKINEDIPHMSPEEYNTYKYQNKKHSQYRGVTKDYGDKWKFQVWDSQNKRIISIGGFATEIEAAKKFNEINLQVNGEKAKLNNI